jgi:hypothetical protein
MQDTGCRMQAFLLLLSFIFISKGALQNRCHPEFISGFAVEYLRIAFNDILGTDAETPNIRGTPSSA